MLSKISFVLIGGVLAQGVHFLSIPIIAQMYGPELFGQYSQFFALYQIILPISALCLPLAIVLPTQDRSARDIAYACIDVGTAVGVLIGLGLLIFSLVSHSNDLHIYWLLAFLPMAAAAQQSGYQWLMRRGRLFVLATLTLSNAVLVNAGRILFGLFFGITHLALAAGTFAGFVCVALMSFALAHSLITWPKLSKTNTLRAFAIIKRYRHFALFRTPQTLISVFGRNMPILYLSIFAGNEVTGHFALAVAVLGAGVLLLGNSVSSIFYPYISNAIARGQRVRTHLIKTTIGVGIGGLVAFSIVIFVGPDLFAWVFGATWRPAGAFAQWMVPWFVFWLASRPSIDALPAMGRQKWLLKHEVTCLLTRGTLLAFCLFQEISSINMIVLLSFINSLLYLYIIIVTICRSN